MTISPTTPFAHHIGFVARDCYKMARAYEKLLGARFDLLPELPVHDLYDQPGSIRVAYGAFGGLVVEIIEPISGDYFLGQTLSEAIGASRSRHPDRLAHAMRVGHRAAVHFGLHIR